MWEAAEVEGEGGVCDMPLYLRDGGDVMLTLVGGAVGACSGWGRGLLVGGERGNRWIVQVFHEDV